MDATHENTRADRGHGSSESGGLKYDPSDEMRSLLQLQAAANDTAENILRAFVARPAAKQQLVVLEEIAV